MLARLLAVSAGLLMTLAVYAAGVELADHHPDRYTVRKGDTLWDISARFLKKPWYWPDIWQANAQIKNPHLIYPGDVLVLDGGRLRLAAESLQPRIRATPVSEAIEPLPLGGLKPFLEHTRIVGEAEFEHAPHVVGLEGNRLRGSAGQLVYVRGLDAQPGQKLALVRALGRYYDMPPVHAGAPSEVHRQAPDEFFGGRPALLWQHGPMEHTLAGDVHFLGYELLDYGSVEVTRAGDPASVLVTHSDFEVRPGDLVLPVDTRPYDDEYVPHRPADVPAGMSVLAFTDALDAVGKRQVVALSRGARDGVENGQTYSIYEAGDTVYDRSDYPDGSAKAFFHPRDSHVTLPPEFAGHVMVFRTFDRVSYGLIMDAIRPVHLGDFLFDPDRTP